VRVANISTYFLRRKKKERRSFDKLNYDFKKKSFEIQQIIKKSIKPQTKKNNKKT